ncbi:hypothetical protein LT493_26135 [Streptomyces tricolor]|nr:hypothetical protein [Streptomyces tricolor]
MDFHPTDGRPMSDSEAAAEAKRIIEENFRPEPPVRPLPDVVPRPLPRARLRRHPARLSGRPPDRARLGGRNRGGFPRCRRRGHRYRLRCLAGPQGLASVTLTGVLMVTLPFAGLAMAATAIGGAISRARSAVTKNIYEGPVTHTTEINNHSTTRGMFFARTRNDIHS